MRLLFFRLHREHALRLIVSTMTVQIQGEPDRSVRGIRAW
jgi:hypothetical protein